MAVTDMVVEIEEPDRQDGVQRLPHRMDDPRIGEHLLDQSDMQDVVGPLVGEPQRPGGLPHLCPVPVAQGAEPLPVQRRQRAGIARNGVSQRRDDFQFASGMDEGMAAQHLFGQRGSRPEHAADEDRRGRRLGKRARLSRRRRDQGVGQPLLRGAIVAEARIAGPRRRPVRDREGGEGGVIVLQRVQRRAQRKADLGRRHQRQAGPREQVAQLVHRRGGPALVNVDHRQPRPGPAVGGIDRQRPPIRRARLVGRAAILVQIPQVQPARQQIGRGGQRQPQFGLRRLRPAAMFGQDDGAVQPHLLGAIDARDDRPVIGVQRRVEVAGASQQIAEIIPVLRHSRVAGEQRAIGRDGGIALPVAQGLDRAAAQVWISSHRPWSCKPSPGGSSRQPFPA